MDSFGKKLRALRKQKGLSLEELGKKIGSSKQVLSKYENAHRSPRISVVSALAEALDVSLNYFDDVQREVPIIITPEWYRPLVSAYQAAEKAIQEATCAVLRIPYLEPNTEPEEKYVGKMIDMIVYNDPAAAGIPLYADSEYEHIEFPEDQIPKGADFGIRISGDSMEPTIPDGEVIFVRKTYDLGNGQIGVFMIDDTAVCKRFYKTGKGIQLESDNREYEPIKIRDFERFGIVGRVLEYR